MNASERNSEAFRARVRQMLAAGYSAARIAKETGKQYAHVRQIVEQERATAKATGDTP